DCVYQSGGRVVYGSMSNRVAITKPVVVQSVNGPNVTAIIGYPTQNPAPVRCVYATNGAILSGFTLANGATRFQGDAYKERSGGAIWSESASVVITNCVLTNNFSAMYGGASCGGTLNNCRL